MEITVRLFAAYRDAVRGGSLTLDLPDHATAGDALQETLRRYPQLEGLSRSLVVAVNAEYAELDTELRPGDEVALIPPVSGGATPREGGIPAHQPGAGKMFRVTAEAIDVSAVTAEVTAPEHGAVVVFLGVVRNHSEGRQVVALEYDAYPAMAEGKMAEIGEEIAQRWPQCRVAACHRVGKLAVGDISLVLAVGSPHRQEAYAASRYAIDRLKELVPIWKREVFADGAAWVEGHEVRPNPD